MVAALNAVKQFEEMENTKSQGISKLKNKQIFSGKTMIGALARYISTPNTKFQPMNANFGILPDLGYNIRDKKIKYGKLADRALCELKEKKY